VREGTPHGGGWGTLHGGGLVSFPPFGLIFAWL
jgi:hypothetical protein